MNLDKVEAIIERLKKNVSKLPPETNFFGNKDHINGDICELENELIVLKNMELWYHLQLPKKENMEEIIENNRIIALFMGAKPYYLDNDVLTYPMMENPAQSKNLTTTHHVNDLRYHLSWEWIMPVIEKIEQLYKKSFPNNEDFKRIFFEEKKLPNAEFMNVIALPLSTSIDEVYKEVIKFITWYNNKKETHNQ